MRRIIVPRLALVKQRTTGMIVIVLLFLALPCLSSSAPFSSSSPQIPRRRLQTDAQSPTPASVITLAPTTATAASSSTASPTMAATDPEMAAPSMAPTFAPTPSPTPAPTSPPPVFISLLITLAIAFPSPVDVNYRNFNDNVQAQNAIKDALTISLNVIKRPDIELIQAVKGGNQLELRLKVRINALLQTSGYSTPPQYYDALSDQFRNADKSGTLNRNLQNSAIANGVNAFAQARIKSYTLPTTYLVNNEQTSAVIPVVDDTHVPSKSVPVAVIVPSVIAGVLVLVAMVIFSKQRADAFQIPGGVVPSAVDANVV